MKLPRTSRNECTILQALAWGIHEFTKELVVYPSLASSVYGIAINSLRLASPGDFKVFCLTWYSKQ